jgi:hypothetical protein
MEWKDEKKSMGANKLFDGRYEQVVYGTDCLSQIVDIALVKRWDLTMGIKPTGTRDTPMPMKHHMTGSSLISK